VRTNWKTYTWAAVSLAALSGAVGLAVGAPAGDKPPTYKYDPTWPKEPPNKWTMEGITGLFMDKDDHILVTPRRSVRRPANAVWRRPRRWSSMWREIL
jgi:hypothetical protein